ncbi:MBL fold metallo-hydrolase [Chitinophaga pendula]|uniref:MBL fold metallo-hydrolase n=1 Tax=Chitinophaga TaxID=79328 RepID=UPI000BB068E7|nr:MULTISPECIES: MBL fold metallo-hydrolase [Chitinophaga]ASZ10229.1 MBL fold metallo-hydrolase [Chitinophaga sp. MD30]UCJ06812.1 MBL fold metallo-hydrolase [Chitinophaga pendula]
MTHFICNACGVQYAATDTVPARCPICEDERQYVPPGGQTWTTLEQVRQRHRNIIELVAPDLYAIYSTPDFAIGQRAHLVISPGGNVLWDCVANLDASTISIIRQLGGIKAMAISHPHYFSTIVEWGKTFGAPVYVHAADAQWLGRRDNTVIRLWEGASQPLWDGMQLVWCGGHFEGANVLHWPAASAGQGALLVGDVIQVSTDRKTVSFMYSYPNNIPLRKLDILQIEAAVQPFAYDAMYGAFGKYIVHNAKQAMAYSVQRYLKIYE